MSYSYQPTNSPRLCTPGSASTITRVTSVISGGSSSSAVNIFEDLDEDNDDERNEEANFDD